MNEEQLATLGTDAETLLNTEVFTRTIIDAKVNEVTTEEE